MYGRVGGVGNRPECVSNGPELSETRRTARRKIKHKITVCRVGATRNTRASILLWVQVGGGRGGINRILIVSTQHIPDSSLTRV